MSYAVKSTQKDGSGRGALIGLGQKTNSINYLFNDEELWEIHLLNFRVDLRTAGDYHANFKLYLPPQDIFILLSPYTQNMKHTFRT